MPSIRFEICGVPIIFTQGIQTEGDKTPYWYRLKKSGGPPPYSPTLSIDYCSVEFVTTAFPRSSLFLLL